MFDVFPQVIKKDKAAGKAKVNHDQSGCRQLPDLVGPFVHPVHEYNIRHGLMREENLPNAAERARLRAEREAGKAKGGGPQAKAKAKASTKKKTKVTPKSKAAPKAKGASGDAKSLAKQSPPVMVQITLCFVGVRIH